MEKLGIVFIFAGLAGISCIFSAIKYMSPEIVLLVSILSLLSISVGIGIDEKNLRRTCEKERNER